MVALAALAALAGCGGDEQRQPSIAEHQAQVARDPYAVTCADLARQSQTSSNQRLVIDVEFALTVAPALRVARRGDDRQPGRPQHLLGDHRDLQGPAGVLRAGARRIAAVQRGEYLVQPRPKSWSKPELWSDPVVKGLRGD